MDHADIRGLGTALHRSVAGLPRSSVGDHPEGCPHRTLEGSPHRVRASRCRSGVSTVSSWWCSVVRLASGSVARADMPADVPDEAGEFARERDADLVVLQAAGLESPVPMAQAQLRTPGDRADRRGLIFLAHLQHSAHAGGEAVVPGRPGPHPPYVGVAGLGNGAEPAVRATG